ncbi:MAG TPA: sulfite exporter TauE/SafE family protein, partial [Planctomycetota bacterium]|nr:sulfite exporter TauE/SafE family protein [Planctomycetota bacterium]
MPDAALWIHAPVGVAVGLVGSLIGVGGGFFVVPYLLFFFGYKPDAATAASLGIVLLNALSATASNALRKRIDWKVGTILAVGSLPTAWLGRVVIGRLTAKAFSYSFAALLTGIALYLVLVRLKPGKGALRGFPRELVDADGQSHRYEVNLPAAVVVSLVVGLVSSLFGVGGGLILVPFMVMAYGTPTVVATATSQYTFLFTAIVGLIEAVRQGQTTAAGWQVVGSMGVGVIVGAQLGVALAKRVR